MAHCVSCNHLLFCRCRQLLFTSAIKRCDFKQQQRLRCSFSVIYFIDLSE